MNSINSRTQSWCESQQIPAYFVQSTTSTNTWAKAEFKGTDPLAVFLADHQTDGRGRGPRTWTNAKPGATLLSTWCLKLEHTPQPIFSIRTGLLLWESLRAMWPQVDWALKAPNDIYVGSGKFAGILIEVEQQVGQIKTFIGIGANIEQKPENVDQATFALAEKVHNISETWPGFCNHFVKGLFEFRKDAQRQRLTAREIERLLEGLSLYPDNQVQDVLPDGGLILKNNDRIHWNEL